MMPLSKFLRGAHSAPQQVVNKEPLSELLIQSVIGLLLDHKPYTLNPKPAKASWCLRKQNHAPQQAFNNDPHRAPEMK